VARQQLGQHACGVFETRHVEQPSTPARGGRALGDGGVADPWGADPWGAVSAGVASSPAVTRPRAGRPRPSPAVVTSVIGCHLSSAVVSRRLASAARSRPLWSAARYGIVETTRGGPYRLVRGRLHGAARRAAHSGVRVRPTAAQNGDRPAPPWGYATQGHGYPPMRVVYGNGARS